MRTLLSQFEKKIYEFTFQKVLWCLRVSRGTQVRIQPLGFSTWFVILQKTNVFSFCILATGNNEYETTIEVTENHLQAIKIKIEIVIIKKSNLRRVIRLPW